MEIRHSQLEFLRVSWVAWSEISDLNVFDALPDVLLVVREERIVWANEAAVRLLGESLVGSTFEEVLAPGERQRLGLLEKQRGDGWDLPATCRVRFSRRSDNTEITTDLRFGQSGDALVLSARDVTEVTRAEDLMRTLAEMFARGSTLLDADALLDATEPIFVALGRIVAFTELVAGGSITTRVIAKPGDPVGDYGRTLVGVHMPHAKTPILAEVVRTGRPIFLDNVPTLLPGVPRTAKALGASMERAQLIRSAWCPVRTKGRVTHHLAVTGRDLTEHDFVAVQLFAAQLGAAIHAQALRAELVHKERLAAVGEMAAVMAHEVRNPLGVIFNALTTLRKKRTDTSARPELLDIIHEEAERLRCLVTDLLDYARPSAVEVESVALEPVLRQAVEAARLDPTFGGAAEEVELEMPEELPPVDTYPILLRRALVNLLVNALQNVDKGGRVSLAVRLDEHALLHSRPQRRTDDRPRCGRARVRAVLHHASVGDRARAGRGPPDCQRPGRSRAPGARRERDDLLAAPARAARDRLLASRDKLRRSVRQRPEVGELARQLHRDVLEDARRDVVLHVLEHGLGDLLDLRSGPRSRDPGRRARGTLSCRASRDARRGRAGNPRRAGAGPRAAPCRDGALRRARDVARDDS